MHPSDLKSLRALLDALRIELSSIRQTVKDATTSVADERVAQQESEQYHREKVSHAINVLADQTNESDKSAETNQQRRHGENLVPQWITAIATVLAFIVASIYAWEAHEQSRQMISATQAATRNAELTADVLDTTQSQFDRTMAQTIRQTVAQNEAATAARDAIAATQAQMRLDERAWIVFKGYEDGMPKLDQPYAPVAHFINAGKTPAMKFSLICATQPALSEDEIPSAQAIGKAQGEAKFYWPSMLGPSGETVCKMDPLGGDKFSQSYFDAIQRGYKFYFFGAMVYQDVFKKWHWLTFCNDLKQVGKTVSEVDCHKGNDTGDGQSPPAPIGNLFEMGKSAR